MFIVGNPNEILHIVYFEFRSWCWVSYCMFIVGDPNEDLHIDYLGFYSVLPTRSAVSTGDASGETWGSTVGSVPLYGSWPP